MLFFPTKNGSSIMLRVLRSSFFLLMALIVIFYGLPAVADCKIGIMQSRRGDAQKFKPLMDYLNDKGFRNSLIAAPNYPNAARMFANGEIDAMFSGSAIAAILIAKGLTRPVVRPVSSDGQSTYWAVVIAAKGAPPFTGSVNYFSDKRLIFTPLASAGEIFYYSLPGRVDRDSVTVMKAASHSAALDSLNRGMADVAIIKNRVWDKDRFQFSTLEKVGEDHGENPDNTLLVSVKMDKWTLDQLTNILLGVHNDQSELAKQVRASLEIQGFIRTTEKDFKHSFLLLKRAGMNSAFDFTLP
ncbi:conserved hypothetical protein [Gammaproteobacteria bacterium]